jgi:hypothetical protein
MVKHIVFWKVKAGVTGAARDEALRRIKTEFEALQGRIPGLLRIEIGIDFSATEDSADFALYSEFESRAAVDGYQAHPLHLQVAQLVREIRSERRMVDYDV